MFIQDRGVRDNAIVLHLTEGLVNKFCCTGIEVSDAQWKYIMNKSIKMRKKLGMIEDSFPWKVIECNCCWFYRPMRSA